MPSISNPENIAREHDAAAFLAKQALAVGDGSLRMVEDGNYKSLKAFDTIARDTMRERRQMLEPPADFPPHLVDDFHALVRWLGPAYVQMVPFKMLGHYVRAMDSINQFAKVLDREENQIVRLSLAREYLDHLNRVSLFARRINITSTSQMIQLLAVAEQRKENRGPQPADEWRAAATDIVAIEDRT